MLVPVPIGLWLFSLVADVALRAGWSGPPWSDLAFYTMLGGVIGALIAAIPGFIDYLSIVRLAPEDPSSNTPTIATAHMSFNLLVVSLYAANLYLRTILPPAAALPMVLSVVGIAVLAVSGWLGGTMVYRRRVAVAEPTEETSDPEVIVRRKKSR
jgi:uncharacterized membrane protein